MFVKKKLFIIFFGPPGSGKGTQADMLGENLSLPVVSPGELFRNERDKKTQIGKIVENKLANGRLINDKLIEKILNRRLIKKDTGNGFILDGYPRRKSQLNYLKKRFLKIYDKKDIILAVYINISDKEVVKRIGGRRVCNCGASYNLKYNSPKKKGKCDLCGEKLYQRKDDKQEVLIERLKRFHKRIKPLVNYFKENSEFININGEQTINKVRKEIILKLKCFL